MYVPVCSGLQQVACLVQMLLKCADIGHLAADPVTHKKWALQLEEEFFQQVCVYIHSHAPCNHLPVSASVNCYMQSLDCHAHCRGTVRKRLVWWSVLSWTARPREASHGHRSDTATCTVSQ